MDFLNRIYSLLQEKGISKNKMLTDLSLSKNSFVDWTNRGTVPNGETLIKIARYLDVSVDYLLGASNVRKTFAGNVQENDLRSKIIELVLQLNEENYEKVLYYIKSIVEQQK